MGLFCIGNISQLGKLCRLMFYKSYYKCVASNSYKTIFFIWGNHKSPQYMLEPILSFTIYVIESIQLSSHSLVCEMRHWSTCEDTLLNMHILPTTSSRFEVSHFPSNVFAFAFAFHKFSIQRKREKRMSNLRSSWRSAQHCWSWTKSREGTFQ